jgi:hypothetical protein
MVVRKPVNRLMLLPIVKCEGANEGEVEGINEGITENIDFGN